MCTWLIRSVWFGEQGEVAVVVWALVWDVHVSGIYNFVGYVCPLRELPLTLMDKAHDHHFDCLFMTIGISITASAARLSVGQRATFHCSSDLDPTSITWYENGTVVPSFSGQVSKNPVSSNDEGRVFRCLVASRYGQQERNIIVKTYGKLTKKMLPSYTCVHAILV